MRRNLVRLETVLITLALIVAPPAFARPTDASPPAPRIVGGTVDTSDHAVVLVIARDGTGARVVCSGSVVSPHVVLSAAHCIDSATAGSGNVYGIYLGDDLDDAVQGADPANFVDVQESHFDPAFDSTVLDGAHDVGVFVLKRALAIAPLPLYRSTLDAALVHASVRIVGFGATQGGADAPSGARYQATSPVDHFDAGQFAVAAGSVSPCHGDSGGPAFLRVGEVDVVVGIDSWGEHSDSCTGLAYFGRVDVLAEFADPYIAQFDPGFTPPAAPTTTSSDGGALPDGGIDAMPTASGCAFGGGPSHPASLLGAALLLIAVAVSRRAARNRS